MAARIRAWLEREDGITMVELLTVMAILGFVMAGILTVFVGGLNATTNMNERFQAQQNARLALTSMRNDFRAACQVSVPVGNASATLTNCAADGTTSQITWCAASASGLKPFGLYRQTGGSCAVATGVKRAGSLTTNAVFTPVACSVGSRPQVLVSLPVSADNSITPATYTLSDTITLRNAAVKATCP